MSVEAVYFVVLAPASDPNAQQERDEERLQRRLDGHLSQLVGPDHSGIGIPSRLGSGAWPRAGSRLNAAAHKP
jgi:hypothetical protein